MNKGLYGWINGVKALLLTQEKSLSSENDQISKEQI